MKRRFLWKKRPDVKCSFMRILRTFCHNILKKKKKRRIREIRKVQEPFNPA